MEERLKLRMDVPQQGLQASIRGRTVQTIALEVIELARNGLNARGRLNSAGDNETGFLNPLQEVADRGQTPAERKLALFRGDWNGSVDPVFTECSY
jgi:glutamate--cysteine ligase